MLRGHLYRPARQRRDLHGAQGGVAGHEPGRIGGQPEGGAAVPAVAEVQRPDGRIIRLRVPGEASRSEQPGRDGQPLHRVVRHRGRQYDGGAAEHPAMLYQLYTADRERPGQGYREDRCHVCGEHLHRVPCPQDHIGFIGTDEGEGRCIGGMGLAEDGLCNGMPQRCSRRRQHPRPYIRDDRQRQGCHPYGAAEAG